MSGKFFFHIKYATHEYYLWPIPGISGKALDVSKNTVKI